MIEDQRKHEMRWYQERQALKQAQASRANSAAQAQSILQSLSNSGSHASASVEGSVDHEVELTALDRKVYNAQQEMETGMTAELKSLGVPFFGTDRSLIVSKGVEASELSTTEIQPSWSPKVAESQLLELRRRIIGHLEDLYRD